MIWVVVAIVCAALYPTMKSALSAPDYSVDGSQSSQVEQLLGQARFHGVGGEQDVIVFYSIERNVNDPAFRAVVDHVLRIAGSSKGVVSVVGPYGARGAGSRISPDRHAALALVAFGGEARQRFSDAGKLQEAVARESGPATRVWLTGFSPLAKDLAQVETADGERAEGIGIPVALIVLVFALGALAAAVVPLMLAGAGLLLTFGLITVLTALLRFDVFLLTVVTMIGIGIGIDYSLFIVSRFREELVRSPENPRRERARIADAVGAAIATSGRTIMYSGVIIALSLTSLLVVRAPIFREFVVGTMASVICTLTAALTLLPAVLAQLGSEDQRRFALDPSATVGCQSGGDRGSQWLGQVGRSDDASSGDRRCRGFAAHDCHDDPDPRSAIRHQHRTSRAFGNTLRHGSASARAFFQPRHDRSDRCGRERSCPQRPLTV